IGAYWGACRVSFENNARNVQSDHTRSLVEKDTHLIREIFKKDIHAGILVLDSFSQVQKMMETARQRHQERVQQNNTVIADLFAVPDLLPDANIDIQQRKQKLEELTAEIPDSVWKKLDQASQQTKVKTDDEQITEEEAKQIKRVLNADSVKLESLPTSILAKVRSEDGKWAIYAYHNFDAADIAKGIKFMEESRQLFNPEAGEHVFVGETTV